MSAAHHPQPSHLQRQVRGRTAEHQVRIAGVALRIVFARPALTGTATPRAVGGEPVEQIIEADLRPEARSQPGKPVLATPSTEVAADPHHYPWKIGEAFDHRPDTTTGT